jgi:hypothetical protein
VIGALDDYQGARIGLWQRCDAEVGAKRAKIDTVYQEMECGAKKSASRTRHDK